MTPGAVLRFNHCVIRMVKNQNRLLFLFDLVVMAVLAMHVAMRDFLCGGCTHT